MTRWSLVSAFTAILLVGPATTLFAQEPAIEALDLEELAHVADLARQGTDTRITASMLDGSGRESGRVRSSSVILVSVEGAPAFVYERGNFFEVPEGLPDFVMRCRGDGVIDFSMIVRQRMGAPGDLDPGDEYALHISPYGQDLEFLLPVNLVESYPSHMLLVRVAGSARADEPFFTSLKGTSNFSYGLRRNGQQLSNDGEFTPMGGGADFSTFDADVGPLLEHCRAGNPNPLVGLEFSEFVAAEGDQESESENTAAEGEQVPADEIATVERSQDRPAIPAQSDPDLCVIDRSGQRNGLWHTCYSLLRDRKGPNDSIFCDTGMLSGQGHCRVLPTDLCSLVEGASGVGDSCMVAEDIDDPDRGYIGWRPVRTFRAQEPILEMAEFILAIAAASDLERITTDLQPVMDSWYAIDHTARRITLDERYAEFAAAQCRSGAALVNLMESLGHISLRAERLLGILEENNITIASQCSKAVVCIASSYTSSPIIFDGLREAYFVIEQFQCPDEHGIAASLNLEGDPIRQAAEDRTFGPANIAAARVIFEGDTMSDTELLRARADIHAHLIPEFDDLPNIFSFNHLEALVASSKRLPLEPGFPGYPGDMLEFVLFDLMAQRRGTTLSEVAAILLAE